MTRCHCTSAFIKNEILFAQSAVNNVVPRLLRHCVSGTEENRTVITGASRSLFERSENSISYSTSTSPSLGTTASHQQHRTASTVRSFALSFFLASRLTEQRPQPFFFLFLFLFLFLFFFFERADILSNEPDFCYPTKRLQFPSKTGRKRRLEATFPPDEISFSSR